MTQMVRRLVLAFTFTMALAVIAAPSMCSWVPSWLASYIGCPYCADDAFGPAGGGCSGASSLEPERPRLHASAGRRMFDAGR